MIKPIEKSMEVGSLRNYMPRQSGIAFIEVLVAVLILAIGLLGMAALQVTSNQMTNGAEQRTQAVLLSSDILERIRANRPNRNDYNGINVDSANLACNPGYAPNAGLAVSENDIDAWSNSLVCLLPEATGSVNVNAATGVVTVTIDWERRDPDDSGVNLQTII